MWKIINKFFGVDYVYVENTATSGIFRVKTASNGEKYFQPYPFQINIIEKPVPVSGIRINGWLTIPLTNGVTERR